MHSLFVLTINQANEKHQTPFFFQLWRSLHLLSFQSKTHNITITGIFLCGCDVVSLSLSFMLTKPTYI